MKPRGGKMSKVIVYSTKTCSWCIKLKEFLKENKISFTNKDVGTNKKNADEMIKKSGQQGTPVTDIAGKIIVGFNKEEIKKALKK
jgi:glutaredoxin-like YruB-family protein